MARDSNGVTPLFRDTDGKTGPRLDAPPLDYGPDIGVALRASREHMGMSIQDVADATRIRRAYISALEDMRLDQLPSRPFTIGYVRAYAELVGFEPGAAVARFKEASPDPDAALRAPIGVPQERDPRLGLIGIAAGVILAAIVAWNFAQRALNADEAPPSAAPDIEIAANGPAGPVSLGAPLPAPLESTTPDLYLTPGLETAAPEGASPLQHTVTSEAVREAAAATPEVFAPKGAIFGAAPDESAVTLQARKPASLIVRGSDGSVYFARQMAAGEAYRAPVLKGLSVDVSDPLAFDVFVFGKGQGVLDAAQTPVAKLATRAVSG